MSDETTPSEPDIMEPTLWRRNGWTARVIKNEDDDGWAVEIRKAGLYRELWQCFAILPVIRSVGVQGDERTYAYPIVIRAVTSEDAMTADFAKLPWEFLGLVSNAILNGVKGINRVLYDISTKPPASIEWE